VSGLNASQRGEAMKSLKHDCSGARAMFFKSVWITAPFVVLFYCFLLFDILGDAVGWRQAVWLPASVGILLVVVWIVFQVRIRLFGSSNVNVKFGDLDSSAHDLTKSLLD
jgi:ascorbate-specific PTS system EIIC-type component UlaA